jgi:SAM-dependent methyltransferase
MNQSEMSAINQAAWNTGAYEAWLIESGPPEIVALELKRDPAFKLRRVIKHLGDVNGKHVANPLGSNGKAGVALALLGADVTVFDISESNARYARELALAAGVNLEYIVTDFMTVEPSEYSFDLVLMELGILHYFMDLAALARHIHAMLKPGSLFVVNDFHPICSKLLSKLEDQQSGVRVAADRDYFDASAHPGQVPYQSFTKIQALASLTRIWQLGEIVTAFAQNGFRIETLEETPGWGFPDHVPGLFTLVAIRD